MAINPASQDELLPVLPLVRIACVFNDAYAPHFATLAASLAATRGGESLQITLVVGPDLSADVIQKLELYLGTLNIDLDYVRVPDPVLEKLPQSAAYPSLVWYRLLLPELLPNCSKVLYLDTDVVVLQSLLPLFMVELGTNLFGAVAEPPVGWEAQSRLLGLDLTQGYLNSGVLLLNLAMMRSEKFTEKALEVAYAKNGLLRLPDQEVLNIVGKGRWKKLQPKWNAISYLWLDPQVANDTYSVFDYLVATYSPAIVHFEGTRAVKPWHFRSIHPMKEIYRQMRARTPWPLEGLEGRTMMAAMLRRLPLKWQYIIARCKTMVYNAIGLQR